MLNIIMKTANDTPLPNPPFPSPHRAKFPIAPRNAAEKNQCERNDSKDGKTATKFEK